MKRLGSFVLAVLGVLMANPAFAQEHAAGRR